MPAVLQIQPKNPASASPLSLAGRKAAADRRPVRSATLAVALGAGVLAGGLISMAAASDGTTDLIRDDITTEVVAP